MPEWATGMITGVASVCFGYSLGRLWLLLRRRKRDWDFMRDFVNGQDRNYGRAARIMRQRGRL